MIRIHQVVGLLAPTLLAFAAHAGPCALVSMGKPAQVVVDGRSQIVRTGLRLEQCTGRIRVAEGQVMLVFTRTNGQTDHDILSGGQEVDLDRVGTRDGVSETFGRLMTFVGTNRRVEAVAAARRGDQVPGFPFGLVAPELGDVPIAVADDTGRTIRALRVHARGKPEPALVQVDAEQPSVALPRGRLVGGADYEWQAKLSDGADYAGQFTVVATEVAARVSRRLQAIEQDARLTRDARELLRAAVFDDNGLAWQRDAVYRTLGARK